MMRGDGMRNTAALSAVAKGNAADEDELMGKVMEVVILRETPTITILHIQGVTVAQVSLWMLYLTGWLIM